MNGSSFKAFLEESERRAQKRFSDLFLRLSNRYLNGEDVTDPNWKPPEQISPVKAVSWDRIAEANKFKQVVKKRKVQHTRIDENVDAGVNSSEGALNKETSSCQIKQCFVSLDRLDVETLQNPADSGIDLAESNGDVSHTEEWNQKVLVLSKQPPVCREFTQDHPAARINSFLSKCQNEEKQLHFSPNISQPSAHESRCSTLSHADEAFGEILSDIESEVESPISSIQRHTFSKRDTQSNCEQTESCSEHEKLGAKNHKSKESIEPHYCTSKQLDRRKEILGSSDSGRSSEEGVEDSNLQNQLLTIEDDPQNVKFGTPDISESIIDEIGVIDETPVKEKSPEIMIISIESSPEKEEDPQPIITKPDSTKPTKHKIRRRFIERLYETDSDEDAQKSPTTCPSKKLQKLASKPSSFQRRSLPLLKRDSVLLSKNYTSFGPRTYQSSSAGLECKFEHGPGICSFKFTRISSKKKSV